MLKDIECRESAWKDKEQHYVQEQEIYSEKLAQSRTELDRLLIQAESHSQALQEKEEQYSRLFGEFQALSVQFQESQVKQHQLHLDEGEQILKDLEGYVNL